MGLGIRKNNYTSIGIDECTKNKQSSINYQKNNKIDSLEK